MSILLSDEDIQACLLFDNYNGQRLDHIARIAAKAAAIHAVQYMEGKCTDHPSPHIFTTECGDDIMYHKSTTLSDYPKHRKDCRFCMTEIHKELNIQ